MIKTIAGARLAGAQLSRTEAQRLRLLTTPKLPPKPMAEWIPQGLGRLYDVVPAVGWLPPLLEATATPEWQASQDDKETIKGWLLVLAKQNESDPHTLLLLGGCFKTALVIQWLTGLSPAIKPEIIIAGMSATSKPLTAMTRAAIALGVSAQPHYSFDASYIADHQRQLTQLVVALVRNLDTCALEGLDKIHACTKALNLRTNALNTGDINNVH